MTAPQNSAPMDTARVAARLGVVHRSVTQYMARSRVRVAAGLELRPGDFPLPDGTISGAPYWWEHTIDVYAQNRRPTGRSPA